MSGIVTMKLERAHRLELVGVGVLEGKFPDVLARFETDLLAELRERAVKLGDAAACTTDEWRIVEDCAAALRAELRRHRTSMEGGRLMLVGKSLSACPP